MPRGDFLPVLFVKASKFHGWIVANFRGLVRGHHRRRRPEVSARYHPAVVVGDRSGVDDLCGRGAARDRAHHRARDFGN